MLLEPEPHLSFQHWVTLAKSKHSAARNIRGTIQESVAMENYTRRKATS